MDIFPSSESHLTSATLTLNFDVWLYCFHLFLSFCITSCLMLPAEKSQNGIIHFKSKAEHRLFCLFLSFLQVWTCCYFILKAKQPESVWLFSLWVVSELNIWFICTSRSFQFLATQTTRTEWSIVKIIVYIAFLPSFAFHGSCPSIRSQVAGMWPRQVSGLLQGPDKVHSHAQTEVSRRCRVLACE